MRVRAEGPKESAADRARREQAQDQADAAAERAISDDLRQQTVALRRRFGDLARQPRGGASFQPTLRRVFQQAFGGGSSGSGGSSTPRIRTGSSSPVGSGLNTGGTGGGGFGSRNTITFSEQ